MDAIFNKNKEFINGNSYTNHVAGDNLSPNHVINPTLLQQLQTLEVQGIHMVDQNNDLDGAISKFNECITMCPHYASAYNNRAQLLRYDFTSMFHLSLFKFSE